MAWHFVKHMVFSIISYLVWFKGHWPFPELRSQPVLSYSFSPNIHVITCVPMFHISFSLPPGNILTQYYTLHFSYYSYGVSCILYIFIQPILYHIYIIIHVSAFSSLTLLKIRWVRSRVRPDFNAQRSFIKVFIDYLLTKF